MGRSPCCEKANTNKGAWSKEEDERLISYIRTYGEGCWRSLPKAAGLLRCGKSCRLRWINYLRPDLKRGNFTEEEDELIIKFHSLLGNKWSLIAGRLPGRTDNEIKNYWNTHIKRKMLSRGVDPQTHRPVVANGACAPPVILEANQSKKIEEEGNSSSATSTGTEEERCTDLNLDLSISLPLSSDVKLEEGITSSTLVNSEGSSSVVCLCCNLGFGSGNGCSSCKASSNPSHVIRYYRTLDEQGERINYSSNFR